MSRKFPTETVRAKDLQVGDIVLLDRYTDLKGTAVVSKVSIVPVDRRPTTRKKLAMREILVTTPKGKTMALGWSWQDGTPACLEPTSWVERTCDKGMADLNEKQETILSYRVGVRTVLSRCETDIKQWDNRSSRRMDGKLLQQLDCYRNDYMRIFELLEALDARMTKDAGKTDVRKPVHPHGRRRG